MWTAIFRNSSGGELDRIVENSEATLKEKLREMLDRVSGWSLSNGDRIEIEAPD